MEQILVRKNFLASLFAVGVSSVRSYLDEEVLLAFDLLMLC